MSTTEVVKLYGAAWSVYVRIARLALEEKPGDSFCDLCTGFYALTPPRSLAFNKQ